MKFKNFFTKKKPSTADKGLKNELNGYPVYPPEEDIYNQGLKDSSISTEAISKTNISKKEVQVEIDTTKDLSDMDLDVPGSELDDEQEIIGNEDEENNYYSLGGDDHADLEENKGE